MGEAKRRREAQAKGELGNQCEREQAWEREKEQTRARRKEAPRKLGRNHGPVLQAIRDAAAAIKDRLKREGETSVGMLPLDDGAK